MSALGHERTLPTSPRHVRFTPNSGHARVANQCPLSANSGHLPLRLLAVTGRRNFAACSLVEG